MFCVRVIQIIFKYTIYRLEGPTKYTNKKFAWLKKLLDLHVRTMYAISCPMYLMIYKRTFHTAGGA